MDEALTQVGEGHTYQKLLLYLVLLPCVMPCGFHAYSQLFMASAPPHWCRPPPHLEGLHPDTARNIRKNTPNCSCGGIETAEHVVLECPLYDQAKVELIHGTRSYLGLDLRQMVTETDYPMFCRFVGSWREQKQAITPWSGGAEVSRCFMYDRNYSTLSLGNFSLPPGNTSLVPCQYGWDFDYSKYATTVVTEWEMVCHKDFYATLALVLLGLGGLIGNYIFGYLQDSLGRRPSFFIYLFIECFFGIATAFAPDFATWTVFRFGVGFTVPAILGTPYVLAIELVGPGYRTMVTILTNIAYSVGLVALAVVAYLVRDWRQLALATSVPFLTFFLYWWVLPESPRWLLARGRFEEAEKILQTMARVNGRMLHPDFILDLKRKYHVERFVKDKERIRDRTYGVLDLFRTPNMRRKTIIITFIWFTNTSVYVGLSYYAAILGGDEFLNFLLAGAVELPTYLVLWPSMEMVGRRWTLCVSMLIGGVACLATVLSEQDDTMTLVLYCIGKMGISSSYVVLPLMASELYPTVVRGLGMSTSSVAGMLGPVFIPIVNYMGEDRLVLPLVVMGSLLVAGGGCSLLLPETLHQHLPQTLEDGENFGKEWFSFCPNKVGVVEKEKRSNVPDSPIKSLLHVSLKETPASTPLATDITSSDVTSDTVLSVQEQTLRVTVV